jgi:hypothetical protein
MDEETGDLCLFDEAQRAEKLQAKDELQKAAMVKHLSDISGDGIEAYSLEIVQGDVRKRGRPMVEEEN